MDIITILLFVAVIGGGGFAWIREQRTWTQLQAAPAHRSADVTRLYHALLREDLRVRYKVTSPMMSASGLHRGGTQTAVVLVHRDDLPRAREIQSTLHREERPNAGP